MTVPSSATASARRSTGDCAAAVDAVATTNAIASSPWQKPGAANSMRECLAFIFGRADHDNAPAGIRTHGRIIMCHGVKARATYRTVINASLDGGLVPQAFCARMRT